VSKGPRLKPWVKWYIRTEADSSHDEPRDSVAERVEQYLADKGPVPSRDTINKLISEVRNRPDPEDRPWSVLDIAEYPIPPEALPVVLTVHFNEKRNGRSLTIRQALWVARLYSVFYVEGAGLEFYEVPALARSARHYASLEKAVKYDGGSSGKLQDTAMLWDLADDELQRRVIKDYTARMD